MIKKSSYLIVLFFCVSILKANSYTFDNNNFDLELLLDGKDVTQINFDYNFNSQNNIKGSLLLNLKEAHFKIYSSSLEYNFIEKFMPKSGKKTKKTIHVDWQIKTLKISDKYSLDDVTIQMVYKSKFIELSMYDSSRSFEYFIYRNDNGSSPIYLFSNNAGEILKARKINKEIVGGDLFITGEYKSGKEYEAILKVRNFKIKDKSKYEKLLYSTRIFDFISIANNAINKFSYMEVPFKKDNQNIYINDGFVVGGLVGFTFNGVTNLNTKTTDIDGFYGPIYLFDQYVDKIPLLNNLLTNNKNESFLGTNFEIETDNNETSIKINPLSIITPGKTKRIFKFFDVFKKKEKAIQE